MTAEPIFVARLSDCPPGQCLEVPVQGRILALFNVDGKIFALDGVCPHQGGPLGRGSLEGHVVTCPWHGWQFDVRDGSCLISSAIEHPTVNVTVEGDRIVADAEEFRRPGL